MYTWKEIEAEWVIHAKLFDHLTGKDMNAR